MNDDADSPTAPASPSTPGEPMSADAQRREELLRAGGSTEADAAPRIRTSDHDGRTRIDIADTAAVRPGPGPGSAELDGEVTGEAGTDAAAGSS